METPEPPPIAILTVALEGDRISVFVERDDDSDPEGFARTLIALQTGRLADAVEKAVLKAGPEDEAAGIVATVRSHLSRPAGTSSRPVVDPTIAVRHLIKHF